MSKHAKSATTARPTGATGVLVHEGQPVQRPTFEGGAGYALDEKTELFTLATTGFFGEKTFYESAAQRDSRFVGLVQFIARQDPDWLAAFIPWLRDEANMRTVAVVAAIEYARSVPIEAKVSGRQLIARTLTRADEPAEALAYHLINYGKPKAYGVKRGLADAAVKLYDEYAVAKYDSSSHNVRMGDVIELCHPRPLVPLQGELFRYILDRRHGRDAEIPELLQDTRHLARWRKAPVLSNIPNLMTWEGLSSHFPMDAASWEAIIPKMGYMALLRNLRNFEEQKVSIATLNRVADKLRDPEQVARSRQLPFRFYSAYNNLHTDRFKQALADALDECLRNLPEFPGRTLILVDTSSSMFGQGYSEKGTMLPAIAAALFGCAVAHRSNEAGLFAFADGAVAIRRSGAILRDVQDIHRVEGVAGHSTQTWPSLVQALREYPNPNRIFIFTDMQSHPDRASDYLRVPRSTPIHCWDLAGHGTTNMQLGSGRYQHGGLTDHSFKVVKMLEEYRPGAWPWEA